MKTVQVLLVWLVLTFAAATGSAVPLQTGEIVVASITDAIHRVHPATGVFSTISSGGQFDAPFNIAVSQDGGLVFVADQNANVGTVFRVDVNSGSQTVLATGPEVTATNAIALGPDGNLYITRRAGTAGAAGIVRVNPTTGAVTPVSVGGHFDFPRDLEITSDGTMYVLERLYADGNAMGAIIKVDQKTGSQVVTSSGQFFSGVQGLGSSADGFLYVTDRFAQARILRVDPITGAQSIVSEGGTLCSPRDVAVERSGNLVISDLCATFSCPQGTCVGAAIVRVDRTTGEQSILGTAAFSGDQLEGIVVVSGGNVTPAIPSTWGRLKAKYGGHTRD